MTAAGVAVLGTGSIGTRHLEVLRGIEGVTPIAVPKRRTRLQELEAAGMPAARDVREAVRRGATRAIVATETRCHVEDAGAAMAAGLDVLVEKPLATTAREARRLQRHAQAARRRLFVGCTLRFSESLNAFRGQLAAVGAVHTVHIECQSYLPDWRPARPYQASYSARAEEGGVLRDLIHEVDYAGWIFGWPSAVQARLRNLGRLGIASEELAALSWETPTGALVSVTLDYLTKPPRRCLRACGEHGTLEWDGVAQTVTLSIDGEPPRRTASSQERNDMFRAQACAFLNANHGHEEARLATAEDGIRALAVCDAARRASAHRRQEPVDYS